MYTTVLALFLGNALALPPTSAIDRAVGADLASYVSRPDLRPPIFNVRIHDAEAVSSGYWFVTTAATLFQPAKPDQYEPYQIGPHIYDNSGELVWSGASLVQNRNSFDFRVTDVGGSPHLSFILGVVAHDEFTATVNWHGAGVIANAAYEVQSYLEPTANTSSVDMHEFNVFAAGRRTLIAATKLRTMDVFHVELADGQEVVMDQGFQEVDLDTGTAVFEWDSLDHGVSLNESTMPMTFAPLPVGVPEAWDYFHINSVDKSADGDYLISARHTDCIYKISGSDGSIIWRLGGVRSSIVLDDFTFSRQHDARIRHENSSVTIITFLDNASDGTTSTSGHSSALMVAIYNTTSPMTARVLQRWDRPDKGHTLQRGNVQFIPNSENIFVCWSDRGYVSEFSSDGRCLLEAVFSSDRFNVYRAYKFNFTGTPSEPPALKVYAYPSATGEGVSTFHVSWNGATEVALWKFYGSQGSSGGFVELGTVAKTGFETSFASSYVPWCYAVAVAANGSNLERSAVQHAILQRLVIENGSPQKDEGRPSSTMSGLSWGAGGTQYVILSAIVGVAFFTCAIFTYLSWSRWWTIAGSEYRSVPYADDVDDESKASSTGS